MKKRAWPFGALILAAGLAVGGFFIGSGVSGSRLDDRYVTVKGVAEREVKADLALWPLHFVSADSELSAAQARLAQNVARTMDFLRAAGLDVSQVELQGLRVTDASANAFQERQPSNRFVVNQVLMVRSQDPDRILAASQAMGELVAAGVVLSSGPEWRAGGPTFLFTGLNDLKPAMIAEATSRAREAAEEFAQDSGSRIGGIRKANQGVFEILPRDQAAGVEQEAQLYKTVRVVSTVEYFLKD
jgi:hypothetical protein